MKIVRVIRGPLYERLRRRPVRHGMPVEFVTVGSSDEPRARNGDEPDWSIDVPSFAR